MWEGEQPTAPADAPQHWHVQFEVRRLRSPATDRYRPFSRRRHHHFALYDVALDEARVVTWPGAWENIETSATLGPLPFTGSLRVGTHYDARLVCRIDGDAASWQIDAMDTPKCMASDTVAWANPDQLPMTCDIGDQLDARFEVVDQGYELRLTGVLLPESSFGLTLGFPHWVARIDTSAPASSQ